MEVNFTMLGIYSHTGTTLVMLDGATLEGVKEIKFHHKAGCRPTLEISVDAEKATRKVAVRGEDCTATTQPK